MKNKNLFFKIYISLLIVFILVFSILSILGKKNRVGYLGEFDFYGDYEEYIDKTLELNGLTNIKENYMLDGKLDKEAIKKFILTNDAITNYSYGFRIKYYDKVFRNSDIYGVYIDTNKILEDNSFVKEIVMGEDGSPFGNLISTKIINEDKIDNISYSLKLNINIVMYVLFLLISILFIYIVIFRYGKICVLEYIYNDYENNYVVCDILLSISSLWAFISIWYVIISKLANKINYTSYLPYTLYPSIFIFIFIIIYLFLYKNNRFNSESLYMIRINLLYMLIYFLPYSIKADITYYIVILHVILICLTPLIKKIKFSIVYKFNESKIYHIIRNQIITLLLFFILYFVFESGFYLSFIYYIVLSFILLMKDLYSIYNKRLIKIISVVFTSLIIIFIAGENGKMYGDFFSEANVHTAGMNFRKYGLLSNYLLPNFTLPYENDTTIYTHYPPLPDIFFGILYTVLPEPKNIKEEWYSANGKNLNLWIENVSPMLWKYRLFPYILHTIGCFFLWAFFRKISKDSFLAMLAALLMVLQPALLYFKFGLHYMSYGTAVLMTTPYFIYKFITTNNKKYAFVLILLGFLQGGLSFDFILPGVGISFLFFFLPKNEKIYFDKKVLYSSILLIIGVSIAFVLHFIQNSLYFGSVKMAFDDLFGAFLGRSSSIEYIESSGYLKVEGLYFFNLLREYSIILYQYLDGTKRYFTFPILLVSVLLVLMNSIFGYLKIYLNINSFLIKSDYFKRSVFFLLGAIAVSSAWVLIMKQHSLIHVNIIPRHFIVLFFAIITFLLTFSNYFNEKDKNNND